MNINTYAHTLIHLKFKQIIYQLYYRCIKVKVTPLKAPSPKPWKTVWNSPAYHELRLSPEGIFSCLGQSVSVLEASSWNSPIQSKLWLYHLHYFDDLNAVQADRRRDELNKLMQRWIIENPPVDGNGWEPYPLSLRIVNWVKWFSRMEDAVPVEWLNSLSVQTQALLKQIEYHILGNHLFVNGKALVFVGTFFSGKRAKRWQQKGLKILDAEVKVQFLPDGGHFELSPMYHATVLWDLCDLVNLAYCSADEMLLKRVNTWQGLIERGLFWLQAMSHPEGDISFFNDSTLGVAPSFAICVQYAKQLHIELPHAAQKMFSHQLLKPSGYCVVNLTKGSKAILDVANIGPDYQPGHAHADTLSFELSLHGQRFLVNSGVSQYGLLPQRQYERSTKAHNTVCINQADSSEVWGGFRVARRAYPKDLLMSEAPDRVKVSCAHNGYLRLAGRNWHQRTWDFTPHSLTICDIITGPFASAEARFYLHPEVNIIKKEVDGLLCCFLEDQQVMISLAEFNDWIIEPSYWHPAFGVSVANHCLVVQLNGHQLVTRLTW